VTQPAGQNLLEQPQHSIMAFLSKTATAAITTSSSGGGYLNLSKLQDKGSVRVTILSDQPLEYYEVWGTSGTQSKPFRFDYQPTPEDVVAEMGDFEAREGRGGPGTQDIKFAISCPVFNYETGNVQVWSVTQKTIMKELDDISKMEDYDKDLTSIDLIISKNIQANGIPQYTVRPVPKKKGSQEHITAAWLEAQEAGFALDRLLTGGNPFKAA
jgi:hypothetical protein